MRRLSSLVAVSAIPRLANVQIAQSNWPNWPNLNVHQPVKHTNMNTKEQLICIVSYLFLAKNMLLDSQFNPHPYNDFCVCHLPNSFLQASVKLVSTPGFQGQIFRVHCVVEEVHRITWRDGPKLMLPYKHLDGPLGVCMVGGSNGIGQWATL